MAVNIWIGGTAARAQVCTATPATVEIGDIFTLTVTEDDGVTASVSFTATAATVANVTAGLAAAWNASYHRLHKPITATDDTTHVTLTANTAGIPFALSSSTTDGGGANTQTLVVAVTVSNKGPNDRAVPENWSLGAVPVATDDVVFPAGAAHDVLYSLDMSAVAIDSLVVEKGFARQIGRFTGGSSGKMLYLRCDPNALRIAGSSSLVAIDIGSAVLSPYIDHTGTPTNTGRVCIYLKGSGIADVNHKAGHVAIAGQAGDSATVTGTMHVGAGLFILGHQESTLTLSGTTLVALGGTSELWGSVPTINVQDGVVRQEAGAWTTATIAGGVLYANAAGTYDDTEVYPGGRLSTETQKAKTFTDTVQHIALGVAGALPPASATLVYTHPTATAGQVFTYGVFGE